METFRAYLKTSSLILAAPLPLAAWLLYKSGGLLGALPSLAGLLVLGLLYWWPLGAFLAWKKGRVWSRLLAGYLLSLPLYFLLTDLPQVIFTTAYDQHALQAFDANALDYLLKPIVPARLALALQKLQRRQARSRPDQIFLRDGERCWIVKLQDIDLLEADGNCTRVFFRKERPLAPGSLAAFEQRLPAEVFFRASRKHIINLNSLEGSEWGPAGNLVVKMRGGQEVELSRRQSAHLREILSL